MMLNAKEPNKIQLNMQKCTKKDKHWATEWTIVALVITILIQ